MLGLCLIVQPIHPVGMDLLRDSGLEPRLARSAAMTDVAEEIGDAVAVITRSAGLDAAAMDAAPRLLAIGSHGVGVNAIDLDRATVLGIPVFNTPDANRSSVAEHTLALMLAVAKDVMGGDAAVRRQDFDFKYSATLVDLSGKTLGIVGFGGIGSRVAAMARAAFGMEVLVASSRADPAQLRGLGYRLAPLHELLAQSDVVSLHMPMLPGGPVIGEHEIALMRPTAILINTARGALIDEAALARALAAKALAGAGLDVFGSEPMSAGHPLLAAPNAVLTPHVAGSSREALERTAQQLVERLVAVLAGQPIDVVNPAVWGRQRRPAATDVLPPSQG